VATFRVSKGGTLRPRPGWHFCGLSAGGRISTRTGVSAPHGLFPRRHYTSPETDAARIRIHFFLSFPQEISPLHSFYTVEPQFAVALIFSLPQSACSQKREMF
jgi:hypothetical protein